MFTISVQCCSQELCFKNIILGMTGLISLVCQGSCLPSEPERDTVPVFTCSYESDFQFASRSRPTCCWHGSVLTRSCTFARKRVHGLNFAELILNNKTVERRRPAAFWCVHILINAVFGDFDNWSLQS
jgi:hypothetical protein